MYIRYTYRYRFDRRDFVAPAGIYPNRHHRSIMVQSYTKDLRALPRDSQTSGRLGREHRSLRAAARHRRREEVWAGIIRQVPAYIRKDRGRAYVSSAAERPGYDATFSLAGRESEAGA